MAADIDGEMERLMGRPLVRLNLGEAARAIEGRTILVTGAGGSIGSEFCRLVARLHDRCRLILVDNNELALQVIDGEMERAGVKRSAFIGDIRREGRLRAIFLAERPDYVVHTAALKHVSVCEKNITEAVLTNTVGTQNVLAACQEADITNAVFLSTDKAVAPLTALGITKALAERLWLDGGYPVARLVNVLGSSGSVLNIFRQQVAEGKPTTVNAGMRRFFMAPEEAASALLVVLTSLSGPQIAVPDVGGPVWIVDLARRVAQEAGKVPDIRVMGGGATEKDTEQLIGLDEEFVRTVPGLTILRRAVHRAWNEERAAA